MEAVFLGIISQLNSSVFVLLAILVLALWVMYKMGGVVTYFRETKDEIRRTELKIDDIRDTLSSVKATTDLLYRSHLSAIHKQSSASENFADGSNS